MYKPLQTNQPPNGAWDRFEYTVHDGTLVSGKGIVALFDGPPGTGKTLCAEIIAGEFDRPLYRVNLPEVVTRAVGETENPEKIMPKAMTRDCLGS